MEKIADKKTIQVMKKENDHQTALTLNRNVQYAAIFVSDKAKKEVIISRQVEKCQKFLNDRGLIFSGDLFIQKEGTDYIYELIRARALSRRFHYMVSFLLCPGESEGFSIGVIMCWNVKNFLGTSQAKTTLKE